MSNIDFYFMLTILFLIAVLIDLVLPVTFGQPSFSYTATVVCEAYNRWWRPLAKWARIQWYTLQHVGPGNISYGWPVPLSPGDQVYYPTANATVVYEDGRFSTNNVGEWTIFAIYQER